MQTHSYADATRACRTECSVQPDEFGELEPIPSRPFVGEDPGSTESGKNFSWKNALPLCLRHRLAKSVIEHGLDCGAEIFDRSTVRHRVIGHDEASCACPVQS